MNFLHSKGVCHGDLKSVNVLIEEPSLIPKLVDFGSAALLVDKQLSKE